MDEGKNECGAVGSDGRRWGEGVDGEGVSEEKGRREEGREKKLDVLEDNREGDRGLSGTQGQE